MYITYVLLGGDGIDARAYSCWKSLERKGGKGRGEFRLQKLSEKGSERRSEGGFGRYEEGEMGRKGPPWRSVGLRHRRLRGFSDSF